MLKLIADEDAEYVDIRFTDPRGKLQHVTVMSNQVDADFIEEYINQILTPKTKLVKPYLPISP